MGKHHLQSPNNTLAITQKLLNLVDNFASGNHPENPGIIEMTSVQARKTHSHLATR